MSLAHTLQTLVAKIRPAQRRRVKAILSADSLLQLEERALLTPSPFDSSTFDGKWNYAVQSIPNVDFKLEIIKQGGSTIGLPGHLGDAQLNDIKIHKNILKGTIEGTGVTGTIKVKGGDVDIGFWTTFQGKAKIHAEQKATFVVSGTRTAFPPG